MHAVAIVASVLLGAVFLTSAITKVAAPQQWRHQATELGVPPVIIEAIAPIEALLGAVLVVQWHRRVAGAAGLALLVAFTGLLVLRLAQGRRPPCACFGSLSVKPIGWGHVARNAGFVALAIVSLAAA